MADLDAILEEVGAALTKLNAIQMIASAAANDPDAEAFDTALTQLLLSASILIEMRRKTNKLVAEFQQAVREVTSC